MNARQLFGFQGADLELFLLVEPVLVVCGLAFLLANHVSLSVVLQFLFELPVRNHFAFYLSLVTEFLRFVHLAFVDLVNFILVLLQRSLFFSLYVLP